MPLQAASQWDGLAHVFYDDQLYNGFPASDVGPHGAMHCSIDKMAKGIVGRGVLLDIARLKGVDWLQAGEVDHAGRTSTPPCERQGVEVQSGDIVFFRTGWRTKFKAESRTRPSSWPGSRASGWPVRVAARSRRRRGRVRQLGDRGAAR